jgi:hypothetical protein
MTDDNDKKTATDILQSLVNSLQTTDNRLQNIEYLLKVTLKQLNVFLSNQQNISENKVYNQEPVSVINKENFDTRPKTSKFAEIAANKGIFVESETNPIPGKVLEARPSQLSPDPDGEEFLQSPIRTVPARGQRGYQNKSTKSSVSQIITREDGSSIFLANVEIIDDNGSLINQTRTNNKGRWIMALTPGEYTVHVVKRAPPDSGRKPIDTSYKINVPPSEKPLELDPLTLEDNG